MHNFDLVTAVVYTSRDELAALYSWLPHCQHVVQLSHGPPAICMTSMRQRCFTATYVQLI